MVRAVPEEELDALTRVAPFPYDDYRAWDVGEPVQTRLYGLSTRKVSLRERRDWNRLGREVYDREVLVRHANSVLIALDGLLDTRWLVRLAGRPRPWLPAKPNPHEQERRIRSFLAQFAPCPLDAWVGGFALDSGLSHWLRQLVDYAFVTKRGDVEIVSRDVDLLLVLTHHLDVQLFSADLARLDGMEPSLSEAEVHIQRVQYPD